MPPQLNDRGVSSAWMGVILPEPSGQLSRTRLRVLLGSRLRISRMRQSDDGRNRDIALPFATTRVFASPEFGPDAHNR